MIDLSDGHRCYGCQKQIRDHEPHIHFSLDEWSARQGLSPIGIDLQIAMCDDCTQEAPNGWQQESHEISSEEVS